MIQEKAYSANEVDSDLESPQLIRTEKADFWNDIKVMINESEPVDAINIEESKTFDVNVMVINYKYFMLEELDLAKLILTHSII